MKLTYVLWIVQVLLAALYLWAGSLKLVLPPEAMQGPVDLPILFIRFIGVCEVLGAVGLILPGLLRIRPGLTPVAAACLAIIMCGAIVILLIGEMIGGAVFTLGVLLLDLFVAYGRWRLAPVRSRSEVQGAAAQALTGGR